MRLISKPPNGVQTYPWLTWEKGVAGTGFSIFTIVRRVKKTPIPFAIYLLRYPVGAYIEAHRDRIAGRRLFHLNILLTKTSGGEFFTENNIFKCGRVVLFRPDLALHYVKPVLKGTRYVLMIGWALKDTCASK